MARRRRPEAPPLDDTVPDWLWGEPMGRIAATAKRRGEEDWIAAVIRTRREWRERRDAWLKERGMVVSGMRGLSYQEFKRIEREEPHRVVPRSAPFAE
ncbi:hypothetical protein ACIGBH_33625 [Streptomyces sp. NPDC085929]|uniref:hypothetical protein n=1 Tax=Streptomyces sp. NPDC085929 TaxID=3365739 RepID=UPI0037D611DD